MSFSEQPPLGGEDGPMPNEEEMRAAYEAELKRLRVEDVIVQTVVSLINLGARKAGIAPGTEDEQDPEQLRMAIDSATALMPMVEPLLGPEAAQLKQAISQLQITYAQKMGTGAAVGDVPAASTAPPAAAAPTPGAPPAAPGQAGTAQSSGRLWVPGQ